MTIVKRHDTLRVRKTNVVAKSPSVKKEAIDFSVQVDERADRTFIRKYLSALNSPKALAAWLLYDSKEHEQLLDLSVDPHNYTDPDLFRADYAAVEFLSKSSFLELPWDKTQRALEKFRLCELACRDTNKRIRAFRNRLDFSDINDRFRATLLSGMRHKIDSILGSYSPDEFVDSCDWGPGSTYFLPRKYATRYNKYLREKGTTEACRSFISPWFLEAYPLWSTAMGLSTNCTTKELDFEVISGNKVITVPKNAKTDRVICVEPGLNLWFQKGIGAMIRKRLRRAGYGIDFQSRNRYLCSVALKRGLATVDFSSASDTISYELVKELLPPRWFTLMNSFRSPTGLYTPSQASEPSLIRWEKYSTMGNGFTFELESLIFLALALMACEMSGVSNADVSVFGDDVIIPVEAFPVFKAGADFIGFTVNDKKTYVSSLFRESCGVHYFDGHDTKPFFFKERPTTIQHLFKLANGIRHYSRRRYFNYGCDIRLLPVWHYAVARVPKNLRFFGPEHLGDNVILGNFDESTPSTCRKAGSGIEGFWVRTLKFVPRSKRVGRYSPWLAERVREVHGDNVLSLLASSGKQDGTGDIGLVPSPGSKGSWKVNPNCLVSYWSDIGPWLG